MGIRWDAEAAQTLRRVPFFVRHQVRKKVEEEVAAAGRRQVTLSDLEESKKRHLQQLSKGARGYSLEACFGSSGCDHALVSSGLLLSRLENLLQKADLLSFLRASLGTRLKLHHQFRVTLADCPNGCSQPQIKDVGIIAQARVDCQPETCDACGECRDVCEEAAIFWKDGFLAGIDTSRCVQCGVCCRICPSGALRTLASTYRVLVGGKLGRHPQLARDLAQGLTEEGVVTLVAGIVDFYKANATGGERLGGLINRVGRENFTSSVLVD